MWGGSVGARGGCGGLYMIGVHWWTRVGGEGTLRGGAGSSSIGGRAGGADGCGTIMLCRIVVTCRRASVSDFPSGAIGLLGLGFCRAWVMSFRAARIMSLEEPLGIST